MFTYYIKRIINNKVKLAVILFIFILPVVVVLLSLKDIYNGASVWFPELAAFLPNMDGGACQGLLWWYLPMYFLLISADDCIEDYKLGYKNLLITKWGKNKYFWFNIVKGFNIGFFIIFFTLALNMVMVEIAFSGGKYHAFGHYEEFMQYVLTTPFWDDWIYILLVSFITGFVSMGGVAIALALHNRFLVYPIVFIMWYIPSSINISIMYLFCPFTEYPLTFALPTYLTVVGINIASVIIAYIKVMKYDQI